MMYPMFGQIGKSRVDPDQAVKNSPCLTLLSALL